MKANGLHMLHYDVNPKHITVDASNDFIFGKIKATVENAQQLALHQPQQAHGQLQPQQAHGQLQPQQAHGQLQPQQVKWQPQPNTIYFYGKGDRYYEFTNFYTPAGIWMDNIFWTTSEHYFQSRKFMDPAMQRKIWLTATAREAFDYARTQSQHVRSDWNQIRDRVMFEAVYAKFHQHPNLRSILCGTRGQRLVEHTNNDNYWADGGDGTGQNRLGAILENVRQILCG
jgi:ribA/ribD-fused uncharacterized protein